MIKKLFICLILFAAFWSCKKDNKVQVDPETEVGTNSMEAPSRMDTLVFPVSSNVDWLVESNTAWCKPIKEKEGVKLVLAVNLALEKRTAKVTVSAAVGMFAKIVYVVQAGGPPFLTLAQHETSYDEFGRIDSIAVNSNTNWTAVSNADWCAVSKVNNKLVVNVRQSFQSTQRQAIVTVKNEASGLQETLTATQANASFAVDKDGFQFPIAGGTDQTRVVATGAWVASSNASWLTAMQDGENVKITAAVNTGRPRSGEISVSSGNRVAKIIVSQLGYTAIELDQLALVAIYNSTSGASWTTKIWSITTPLSATSAASKWPGVTVATVAGELRVTGINLSNNNLVGTLPAELGTLTELKDLNLGTNVKLTGGLPVSIANLKNLTSLSLQANNAFFNSALPSTLSGLTNLVTLNLNGTGLTGTIPTWISGLSKLTALIFSNNRMDGNIPSEVTDLKLLTSFQAHSNNFTGSVPSGFGTVSKLNAFEIRNNRLTGAIPADLKSHPNWGTFNKANICPQQTGYGFTNCN